MRLIDSGTLVDVDKIQRNGLEQLWIHGPLLVQSEALHIKVTRNNGLPTYNGNGQYIYGSWILTGESRPYTAGTVGNVTPMHDYGAVELLARYSRLNLDNGSILGGRQHDLDCRRQLVPHQLLQIPSKLRQSQRYSPWHTYHTGYCRATRPSSFLNHEPHHVVTAHDVAFGTFPGTNPKSS